MFYMIETAETPPPGKQLDWRVWAYADTIERARAGFKTVSKTPGLYVRVKTGASVVMLHTPDRTEA